MRQGERYYREITAKVLQRYYELEDGVVDATRGQEAGFDERVLNYRVDIERVLAKLPPPHVVVLTGIHRDGVSHADAVRGVGLNETSPSDAVRVIEVAAGRQFEKFGLASLEEYLR